MPAPTPRHAPRPRPQLPPVPSPRATGGLPQRRAARLRRPARWLLVLAVAVPMAGAVGLAERPAAASIPTPGISAGGFALRQHGKPYHWGAAGPGAFDCSGLTSTAWRAAGVGLPRVSRQQYGAGRQVRLADLRTGDLVFYAYDTSRPSTIHHVGLYLGGGRMVEAPHRGVPVRIASIWRRGLLAHATRPAGAGERVLARLGSHGTMVVVVQLRLAASGYCLAVDGDFGWRTWRAVRDFQLRHRLVPDAIVGPVTWASLVANGRQLSQPRC